MTIEQISPDTQPPDVLAAVLQYVNRYEQGGISNSPEKVAAAVLLQRALEEDEL